MRPRVLALTVLLVLVLPAAAADHPGSNMGLARFDVAEQNLVHRWHDVDAAFAEWESRWPDLVERTGAGSTSTGWALLGVRVTDESVPFDGAALATGEKLRVYLDGGHHGNEYLGVELVMYHLEDLLTRADAGDEDVLRFLAQTEVHAVPIVNVDGNLLDTRKNSRLVDPNRNYDYQWGGPGSGHYPWEGNYRGPSAFSEPEVLANAEFARALDPDLWITMHTGIAEFYWPWGWTHDPSPDDAFFTTLEKPFEDSTNGRVDAMQAAELYLAAGATDDWGYAVLGTPTFTYEVHEDQNIPVYGDPIPEVIADQLAGLDFMVRNVQRMGGWLDVDGGDLVNSGWGPAVNVTITDADRAVLATLPEVAPGARVPSPVDLAGASVTYQTLRIESSRTRTVTVAGEGVDVAGGSALVPAVAPVLALLAVAGVAALRRR